ncbi:hypothetical protein K466DRAFT_14190 [Polyporus arcularius HHB13444]|uniref:Uncharacterized protein n=1 Tax=Polyporus arcularius HHB13444 TaxID=1314778 RepID=A0A5C3PKC0_9APHY|nr:hypothetical protein K466DRAFT_14190 [Polyporus arcularius HHB13444]
MRAPEQGACSEPTIIVSCVRLLHPHSMARGTRRGHGELCGREDIVCSSGLALCSIRRSRSLTFSNLQHTASELPRVRIYAHGRHDLLRTQLALHPCSPAVRKDLDGFRSKHAELDSVISHSAAVAVCSLRLRCGAASRCQCALRRGARLGAIPQNARNIRRKRPATPAEALPTLTTAVSTSLRTSFAQGVVIVPRLVSTSFRVIPHPLASHPWVTPVMVFLTAKGVVSLYPDLQECHRGLLMPACDCALRPVMTLWARSIDSGGSTYARVILIGLGRLCRMAQ